jgi:hypothetical protein
LGNIYQLFIIYRFCKYNTEIVILISLLKNISAPRTTGFITYSNIQNCTQGPAHRNPFIKSTNIRHIQGAAHRNLFCMIHYPKWMARAHCILKTTLQVLL